MSFRDLLQGALATLRSVAGDSIVYRRGANELTLTAMEGKVSEFIAETEDQRIVERMRDFLVNPEELILDDVLVLPQPGDLIEQTINEVTRRYRVIDSGVTPCYEMSQNRVSLRIHTKLVD